MRFVRDLISRLGSTQSVSQLFSVRALKSTVRVHIFCFRQLDFPSEPGVANEIILENEPKSCLTIA